MATRAEVERQEPAPFECAWELLVGDRYAVVATSRRDGGRGSAASTWPWSMATPRLLAP